MNKYFLIKPSMFWKYDDVDIDGNYKHIGIDDFSVSEDEDINSKYNCLFFEFPCKEMPNGKISYGKVATELLSGVKFDVKIEKNKDDNEYLVSLSSEEYGLFMSDKIQLKKVETKASKITGMLEYMKENEELFKNYSYCLDRNLDSAHFYRQRHDQTLYGPNKRLKKELKKGYIRNIKY